ncbi:ribosome biogenesis GTP-binding protein YihA/YsxC [Akkermansiaceae bacterium]|nr:ribosome biogenesis GTP-binding protein YihA/YsxC [Akkermansiaceae bacterium]
MQIHQAEFIKSYQDFESMSDSENPEFAFVGRSNVGKSSVINMLAGGKKNIALVSSRPGRTQLINEFFMNKTWNLIDLPGYGYAKTSKAQKARFHEFVTDYLLNRQNLTCVFSLIDSKLPPQKIDLEFTKWMMECGIPFILVFTKADKSKPNASLKNIESYYEEMAEFCEGPPRYYLTSAETRQGRRDVLDFIDDAIQSAKS